VFTYLSLLVERQYFTTIRVNFLIVGHTHCPIDQYFSTRSKIRKQTHFIGSPLSLQFLFHDHQVSVTRVITILHDWKSWLEPVINQKLHHHALPHVFIFKMEPTFNRAICQFKQFSDESLPWLPIPPSPNFKNDKEKEQEFQLAIKNTNNSFLTPQNKLGHICAGGVTGLVDSVLGKEQGTVTMTSMVLDDSVIQDKAQMLRKMMPELMEIESASIFESDISFQKQSEYTLDCCNRFTPQHKNDLISIQKEMEESSTKDRGYLIWLKLDNNPNFFESAPVLIDHYTDVIIYFITAIYYYV